VTIFVTCANPCTLSLNIWWLSFQCPLWVSREVTTKRRRSVLAQSSHGLCALQVNNAQWENKANKWSFCWITRAGSAEAHTLTVLMIKLDLQYYTLYKVRAGQGSPSLPQINSPGTLKPRYNTCSSLEAKWSAFSHCAALHIVTKIIWLTNKISQTLCLWKFSWQIQIIHKVIHPNIAWKLVPYLVWDHLADNTNKLAILATTIWLTIHLVTRSTFSIHSIHWSFDRVINLINSNFAEKHWSRNYISFKSAWNK